VEWVVFSAVAPQHSDFIFAGWVSPFTLAFAYLVRIGIGRTHGRFEVCFTYTGINSDRPKQADL